MRNMLTGILLLCLLAISFHANAQRVDITLSDTSTISTYILFPDDHSGAPLPLIVLMGGGSGDAGIARDVQGWLGTDLANRGWAVAVPVSPNEKSFRGDNNRLIPLLIESLHKDNRILPGKTLLAGISNGGMSALEIATTAPQDYLGIMAVPAVIPRGLNINRLNGMPVYLRIGDQDEAGWMNRLDETELALREAGARVDAGLVFMAPHMFQMEWETLDPWLQTLKP